MPARRRTRKTIIGRLSRAQVSAIRAVSASAGELDRELLLRTYVDEERSICSIAKEAGVRPRTVLAALVLHGIPLRSTYGRWGPPTRREEGRSR